MKWTGSIDTMVVGETEVSKCVFYEGEMQLFGIHSGVGKVCLL